VGRLGTKVLFVSAAILIALAGAFPDSAYAQSGAWLNTSWLYRNPVTIANPSGSTLTNFQVKIAVGSGFDFTKAKSDGSDLRVTGSDGATQIPFWIERWNAVSQAAIVWVQLPSIPAAGTTVYLYYGNPSATTASDGTSTFLFFDDFESGPKAPGYWTLGAEKVELEQDQGWEALAPHTLSVLQLNMGGHTYWGYYGLQDSCGGVGLAWSEDLVNWTKDTGNPLFTNARWPRVIQVGNTFYMAYTKNYCNDVSHIELASSTDGIHWAFLKTLVPDNYLGNPRNQNADLWINPNDGKIYLYYYSGDDATIFNILARSADSPTGLDSTASEVPMMQSTTTLAAPDMLYYNGTYFLATEALDSNHLWYVKVYSSTTGPTSGFTLLPGNPVLNNGAACMFQTVFGSTLHEYYCFLGSDGVWDLRHRQVSLSATRPSFTTIDPAKWSIVGGLWNPVMDTQEDGTTGLVAEGNLSGTQVLASTFTGANYVLEAHGKQLQGKAWGLGFRVADDQDYYSTTLYDGTSGSPNLFGYFFSGGVSSQLGSATVPNVNANTWYKLSVHASGSGFDILKDDVLQFHTSDGNYASGPVALYGEAGTVAHYNNVLVRRYAVADPTSTVGAMQSQADITPLVLSPTTVLGGVTNSTGTVNLPSPAGPGGVLVNLMSSNTAAATVPPSITVPANLTTAAFTVTSLAVGSVTPATITATFSGGPHNAILTVNPPSVNSATLSPASVTGGSNSTGTVTLSGPAPPSGAVVNLTSSNMSAATVPPTVNVGAGQSSATFSVTSFTVSAVSNTTISATYNGSASAVLTVNPVIVPGSAAFVRAAGNSGESAKYTVTMSPAGGDFLAVFVWQTEGASTPTVTDNLGNAYTRDCDLTYNQGFGSRRLTVFHLMNAPSGVTGVSVTPNKPSRGIVAEYSGMPTTGSIFDVCGPVNTLSSASTTWSSSAAATTGSDLIFGLEDTGFTASAGYKASGAWTGRLERADSVDIDDSFLEDQINVPPGSYIATGTSKTSLIESSVVVAFKTSTGPTPPTITSANGTQFVVGGAGAFTVTATGTAPIAFSETGALPSGVALSSAGVLSGTPVPGSAGTYPIVITASNGTAPNATQNFTLTVGQAPVITSAASATFTAGTTGTFLITATGFPPPTFSETGALPSGVALSSSGALSGTPAAGSGGTYAITITAQNGVAPNATQAFTLTVNQAPAITSAASTTFTVGAAGTFTVTATGFPATTFSETGALASGLTFSSAGVLSGTPAPGSAGTYPIVITASNGVAPNATQNFTLTVGQAPAISSPASATFTVGTAGAFTVTATGFPAPTFSEAGALPPGLTLSSAGVLSGTPAAGSGGTYAITITAQNGVAPNATQAFTLTVNQAPAITSAASTTFSVGAAGTFTVTGTGFPTPTYSEAGSLPSGVTFNTATRVLSGTPAPGTAGTYPISFTASNGAGTNATQNFTLTVNPQVITNAAFVKAAGNFSRSAAYNLSIAPAVGDFLAVFVWQEEGAATPTVADNKGSVYTKDCDLTPNQGFGNRRLTVYHLLNAQSGITGITVTPNKPSRAMVAEYSGMASTAGLDMCGAVNNQTTSVTSWTSPPTTTTGTDIVFGLADSATTATAGYAPGAGWNSRLIQADTPDVDDSYFEDQLNVSAGSISATGTSATAATESTVVVGFKVQ
jgi:hypothetical protein